MSARHLRASRWRRALAVITLSAAAVLLVWPPGLAAATAAPENASTAQKAAVITVDGVIDDIMLGSLERRIEQARSNGATTLIFELDTPGGAVVSALEICRLLIRQAEEGLRTVAWVNPEAYSAGALISVACQEIWMSPAASIGDCAPIMLGEAELGEAERAKAESPVLQMFREGAQRNGYDPLLCRAMVQVGVEVWWLEKVKPADGGELERKFVTGEEKVKLIDDVAAEERAWKLVDADGVMQPVDREDTLLTFSTNEAVTYGFARGEAGSVESLAAALDVVAVERLSITGWERVVMWLNSPMVRGFLFLLVLVGGYLEFQSPGLILPGTVALIALALFLGAPYAAGLADIWTIVLLVLGVGLLLVEIFVVPGFGIFGILGLLLVGISLIGSFVPAEPKLPDGPWWQPLWPSLDQTWDNIQTALVVLSSSVIASTVGLLLLARYFAKLPGATYLVPENPEGVTLQPADPYDGVAAVGDIGVVSGSLKPGGQARFGNTIVEVVALGEYVESGAKVQVIERQGSNVIVRPLPEDG